MIAVEEDLEVVAVVGDADAAIDRARETKPDVALVDVKMPGGGGPRAVKEIAIHSPTTRMVALSAYQDRANVLSMLGAGAVGYLVKGVSPGEIVDALRRAARGQASLSSETASSVIDTLMKDVAERNVAEEVLRRSEERFRALLESAPDGVVIVDARGRIVLVNRQTELLFGYQRDDLLGKKLEVLVPDRVRDTHAAHRGVYLEDPRTRPMGTGLELAGRRKDGSEFPVEISLSTVESAEGRLITAFVRDITERKHGEEARRMLDERQNVLARLVSAGEEERRRIANDIHDDSIQAITAAGMRLQLLRRTLRDEDQIELLGELEETIQLSISRLRHLLFDLRPPALDLEGLTPALRMFVEQTESRDDSLRCTLVDRLTIQPAQEKRLIIYRIVQEALTNVRKHARAASAEVTLDEQDGGYSIRISDNGIGFDGDSFAAPGHLGLLSMRERADLAGGWLRIDSAKGWGTTVHCWIPFESQVTKVPA